jgi:hypothetical protein
MNEKERTMGGFKEEMIAQNDRTHHEVIEEIVESERALLGQMVDLVERQTAAKSEIPHVTASKLK